MTSKQFFSSSKSKALPDQDPRDVARTCAEEEKRENDKANAEETRSPKMKWEPNYIMKGSGKFAAAHVLIQINTGRKGNPPNWEDLPGEWLIPVSAFANTYPNKLEISRKEKAAYNSAWHTLRVGLTGSKAVTAIQTIPKPGTYPAYPKPPQPEGKSSADRLGTGLA